MGKEIERKFLVHKDKLAGYSMAFTMGQRIEQGYIMDDGITAVRVRILGVKGFITIKKKTDSDMTRLEYEYPVPADDALEMLDRLCTDKIEKVRAYIQVSGLHVWEVDIFGGDNEGLIVAEIELKSEDEAFDKPDFIAEEVTDDPRYLNTNLERILLRTGVNNEPEWCRKDDWLYNQRHRRKNRYSSCRIEWWG